MKIYIDGMWFRHTGIGRIYENLLRGLVETEEIERISTVVQRSRKGEFESRYHSPKIKARFVDFPFNYRELLYKGGTIRAFDARPDLLYFPSFNVPFFLPGTIVSTICDLIPITPFLNLPWHVKARYRIAIRHAIRSSVKVVCISEFTKRHVIEEFGVDPDRLEVIYPPLLLPGEEDIARAKGQPPLVGGDYLLYVGNRHAHKNVPCMLEALRILQSDLPGLRAVVAGARMTPVDDVDVVLKNPELRAMTIEISGASDEKILNLHAHARVFVFPTRIEGFGIPPLEALSFGVPVVVSDIPVTREVCGDAVRYADPDDPADFARAIREALSEPYGEEAGLRGKERARRYAGNDSVMQYLALFKRCIDRKV